MFFFGGLGHHSTMVCPLCVQWTALVEDDVCVTGLVLGIVQYRFYSGDPCLN